MTVRRDLASSVVAADRDISRLTAPLAPAVAASVRRHAVDGVITATGRLAILRDVDRLLATVYPTRRGAPSRLERMIVRRAREAQAKPIAAAVGELRGRLPYDLLTVMGDGG